MARTRKKSGSEQLAKARTLFQESVENGRPDFRYVTLAIGAAPHNPPRWAMLECILEHERTLHLASTLTEAKTPQNDPRTMMDAIALAYLGELVRQEEKPRSERVAPKLQEMIRLAYQSISGEPWPDKSDSDAYRNWERWWNDEQQRGELESGSGYELFDLRITPRIEALITSFTGRELDFFEEPARNAYVIGQLLRHSDLGTEKD